MGQANRRGTFKERKDNAIADKAQLSNLFQLLEKQENEWFNSLTIEEQAAIIHKREKPLQIKTNTSTNEKTKPI